MKTKFLSLTAFLFSITIGSAQTSTKPAPAKEKTKEAAKEKVALKHPKKPMLWKVTGKDLKKPSYLFGSIHVGDKNILTLHPAAEEAFLQADTLATEVSLTLANQTDSQKHLTRKDKKTLKEAIGKELYGELDKEIKLISPLLSAEILDTYKTWSAILVLGMLEEQMKNPTFLDLHLWERAKKAKKDLWALETNEEQMGGFDQLTEQEQITLLKDSITGIRFLRKNKVDPIEMLKKPYLEGDPAKVLEVMKKYDNIEGIDKKLNEKFMKLLLLDRNVRMADEILEQLRLVPDKSHFMVAGSLHYLGEGNIIHILEKQGYTVTRVEGK